MTRKELLKKIKKIDIKTSALAEELFVGEYHSCFKGNGMEFSDIRKYELGDDVKRIDWKTSARQRKTYIKEYQEERELSIYVMVDISFSNSFASKMDLITQLVATLVFSADKNNDRFGAIFFSDNIEKVVGLGKGKNHALSIIEEILKIEPKSKGTDISQALNYFNKIQKRRGIVFLISDFLDDNYDKIMKVVSRKHDLIPIRILDRKFKELPKGVLFNLRDSETDEMITVGNFKSNILLEDKFIRNVLDIYTDEDYVKSLIKFFKKRNGRSRL
ncbi:DUF58 domain-containing protein [Fusobacterium sp. MFO224]|uniref:DUF58 domain-containing protein n=1 Tax=Fusobacterium sp. MFO224 TaxID=3378070 RepID=UPI0038550516